MSWRPPPRKAWPLLVQTWPAHVPDHRSYAYSHYARRVVIDNHDCRPMLEILGQAPGILMIEWDIALDGDDLRTLCQRAGDHPDEGFVAPYKLWPGPTWGHRVASGHCDPWWVLPEDWAVRFVRPDQDPVCNLPCFGCIYIPRRLLTAWRSPPHDERLTDTNFALWSYSQGIEWPVLWDVRPAHLHY